MLDFDRQFLLAIGYQKTGSTWLDKHLWRNSELGFWDLKGRELRQIIVGTRPLEFEPERCRSQIAQLFPSIPADLLPVIGMERLSGSPHSGGYDSKEIADRLAVLFPNSKVLIVVREQRQMILSTYFQSIRGGNAMKLEEYISGTNPGTYKIPHFDPARFQYHRLAEYYTQLFGEQNVLVLAYEEFATQPQNFIRQILQFSGIIADDTKIASMPFERKIRRATTPLSSAMLRQFNAWIGVRSQFNRHPVLPFALDRSKMQKYLHHFDHHLPRFIAEKSRNSKQRMLAKIEALTGTMYEDSNARLANKFDLNLSEYGYSLPTTAAAL